MTYYCPDCGTMTLTKGRMEEHYERAGHAVKCLAPYDDCIHMTKNPMSDYRTCQEKYRPESCKYQEGFVSPNKRYLDEKKNEIKI